MENRIESDKLNLDATVLFGDDLSLRDVYFKEVNTVFKPDATHLLQGYHHLFLKNLARDSRAGFFSRINPGIVLHMLRKRTDVLLIHGYETFTAWFALLAAKFLGVKVLWRGEVVPKEEGRTLKSRLKRLGLRFFFRQCDALFFSCSGNKAFLQAYNVAEHKLFPIPCAVDNEFFLTEFEKLKPERNSIRSSLGIADDDFVILFCARFTARKRPMDLISALKQLNQEKIVALFVGDGPEKANLMKAAQDHGVRAIFVGYRNVSEVSRYYAIADVATVISSYDPSPKAMNEAMNFSLPILATKVVGTAEDLIKPHRNGFVLNVGDVDGLAQAIRFLVEHPEEAHAMGRESQAIVAEWSYKKDVDGILGAVTYSINAKALGTHPASYDAESV